VAGRRQDSPKVAERGLEIDGCPCVGRLKAGRRQDSPKVAERGLEIDGCPCVCRLKVELYEGTGTDQ
jgi:uncharacterized metal-binding protein